MAQNVDAAAARQVEVKQNEVRTKRAIVAGAVEEADSFFAVLDNMKVDLNFRGGDGLAHEENVGSIIFDDEDNGPG